MNTQTKVRQQKKSHWVQIAQIVSSEATTLFTLSSTEWRLRLTLCAVAASPHHHRSLHTGAVPGRKNEVIVDG